MNTNIQKAVQSQQAGRYQHAREIYTEVLRVEPNHPEALDHLGVVAMAEGDSETAVRLISKAIRIQPGNPFFHNNLGNALRSHGVFEQAEKAFKRALKLKPDLMETRNNLGSLFKDAGRLDEAMECFHAALKIKPDYAEAHYNLALTWLAKGNYEKGFEEYEWRFRKTGWKTIYPHRLSKPLWNGEGFSRKRLFVHSEQGFGDIFQFVRFLPMVKARGGTVIFETREQMVELMRGFPGIDELAAMSVHTKPFENFDFYVPLLTLPHIFQIRPDTIPEEVPYIHAAYEKAAYWKRHLPKSGFKVGIVWAGRPMHFGVQKRACSLEHFLSLGKIPNVRLVSLQKGEETGRIGGLPNRTEVLNVGELLKDFSDTAGVIENLDLVITVDTSVAHLAGAMGKPVWTVLSHSPDWRWMLEGDHSPWYPTMRLFRQERPGDWQGVFHTLSKNLQQHMTNQQTLKCVSSNHTRSDIQALLEQAVRYHQSGQLSKAGVNYEAILRRQPDHGDALHLSGLIAHEKQDLKSAEARIKKAVNLFPSDPYYHNSLGMVYKSEGKTELSENAYHTALKLKPDLVEAANNMGVLFQDQGRLEDALLWYKRALECGAESPVVHNNMGNAFKDMGKWEEALASYQKAVSLHPNDARAHNNMGVLFHSRGRYDAALAKYEEALGLDPDYVEALINTGITYQHMGNLSQSLLYFKKAIELAPENAEAHFLCSFILLLSGNLEDGWKEYEWRRLKEEWIKAHRYHHNAEPWDGSHFEGKTLFVHSEQGLGDTLQFVRYLPRVKRLGGRVIFETTESLQSLFQGVEGVDEIITPEFGPKAEYDLHVPLMSIPGLFKTTLKSIPAQVPYLFADPVKTTLWKQRIQGPGLKIGLVWAGKPTKDDNRPCRLSDFLPLFQIPGIRFYGLQKGHAALQQNALPTGGLVENFGEDFNDFTDTAAAIQNLDLVISIDTSVTHLAGAMGKSTWTLLPFAPDWRWLTDRDDSPWYPTMRLFRQPKPGDWESVIRQVALELQRVSHTK